ncbi:hypothetical protein BH23PSE1_BH23PSE1_09370 [soil metagenome]
MIVDRESHRGEGSELRFSRGLAAFLIGGIVFLIGVVVASVLWVSERHNDLARASSEQMVRGAFNSFEAKMRTVVRDYSVWDEAHDAIARGDTDWLYSNVGTGAAEIGALDIIVLVSPGGEISRGWRQGSPVEGERGLVPPSMLAAITALLEGTDPGRMAARNTYAMLDGDAWAFAVTYVQPVGGAHGLPADALALQVHGLRLSPELVSGIGGNMLIDDLAVVDEVPPGSSAVELHNASGAVVAKVAWLPPRPGARILHQIALPLGFALLVVGAIATVSSRYAVRSAARLERALVAAQAADRSKTEFLSNVSHELRTPMNGIMGVAQLLKLTDLDSHQRELLDVLGASADTQMTLISDLLDLSRLEGGNRPLVNTPFEPAQILREIVELIRPIAAQKNLALEVEIGALDSLQVRGDARAFRQIMTNLVGNATKFTDSGRVVLNADVRHENGRAELLVRVRDTGRGISEEHKSRIFDRFFQVDGSQSRDAGGTGLGLAISRSLASMMGGRIEVESTPGVGSTFSLLLVLLPADLRLELFDAA